MTEKIIKPRFSLKDWQFWEWFKGNWTTIKEIIKVAIPLFAGLQIFPDAPALQFFILGLGKLALDTVDYWVSLRKTG